MMSDFIKEMKLCDLQSNAIRRNVALDTLRSALKELKKGRKEIRHMAVDTCHIETESIINGDFDCLIRETEALIRAITCGDWCFSVNNTAEREKEIEDRV
jgi:hypothetical protein